MLSGISRGGVVSRARGLSFMYRYEWFPSLVQALVPLFFFASLAQAWSLRFTAARERKQERPAPDQSATPWILPSVAGRVVVVLVSYRTLALCKRQARRRSAFPAPPRHVCVQLSTNYISRQRSLEPCARHAANKTQPPLAAASAPPCPRKASTPPQGKP